MQDPSRICYILQKLKFGHVLVQDSKQVTLATHLFAWVVSAKMYYENLQPDKR